MYAVVELQWHQYIVQQDNTIVVDRLDMEVGQTFSTTPLLVFSNDAKTVSLGTPLVEKSSVVFEVKEHNKWEKIRVVKFKRKNRYVRNFWHRSYQSVLHVVSLNG